jgi:hypothetical protein
LMAASIEDEDTCRYESRLVKDWLSCHTMLACSSNFQAIKRK